MLLGKSLQGLGKPSSRQRAGSGRQASEYIPSTVRLMPIESEWKRRLQWVKLDLQKAFDKVSRRKLTDMLASKLGRTWIKPAWHKLLAPTPAVLWMQSTVRMSSGIKQGAVESPAFFALIADMPVTEASQRFA